MRNRYTSELEASFWRTCLNQVFFLYRPRMFLWIKS